MRIQTRLASSDLVRLFEGGSLAGLSEWQLLQPFLSHRDESAFAAWFLGSGRWCWGSAGGCWAIPPTSMTPSGDVSSPVQASRARPEGGRCGVAARSGRAGRQQARRARPGEDSGSGSAWASSSRGEASG